MASESSLALDKPTVLAASSEIYYPIYSDSLTKGWSASRLGASYNLRSTTKVYQGIYSISFTTTSPTGTLTLTKSSTLDTTPYTTLRLAAQGTVDNQKYEVFTYDQNNKPVRLNLLLDNYGGPIKGNAWTVYNIPLTDLKAASSLIRGIGFANATSSAQKAVYLDDIKLVGLAPTPSPTIAPAPPPPPPTPPPGSGNEGERRCDQTLATVGVKTDFGAKGDGVTDDSAAFAKAIATGNKVNIPAGTFILSGVDVVTSSAVLCGSGQGSTILKQAPSPTSRAKPIFNSSVSSPYFELKGVTVDGNMQNVCRCEIPGQQLSSPTIGLYVHKLLINNTEFINSYIALQIFQIETEAIIRDNWFHNLAMHGPKSGQETQAIFISKNHPSGSTAYVLRNNIEECGSGSGSSCTLPSTSPGVSVGGIMYQPPYGSDQWQKLVITDNTLRNTGENVPGTYEPVASIYIYMFGGQKDSTLNLNHDDVVIARNQIYNSYQVPIKVMTSNNVKIYNNYVQGVGALNYYALTKDVQGWNDGIGLYSRDASGGAYSVDTYNFEITNNTLNRSNQI